MTTTPNPFHALQSQSFWLLAMASSGILTLWDLGFNVTTLEQLVG